MGAGGTVFSPSLYWLTPVEPSPFTQNTIEPLFDTSTLLVTYFIESVARWWGKPYSEGLSQDIAATFGFSFSMTSKAVPCLLPWWETFRHLPFGWQEVPLNFDVLRRVGGP